MTVKDTWILGYFFEILRSLSIQILCILITPGYLDTSQMLQAVPQLKIYDRQNNLDTWML